MGCCQTEGRTVCSRDVRGVRLVQAAAGPSRNFAVPLLRWAQTAAGAFRALIECNIDPPPPPPAPQGVCIWMPLVNGTGNSPVSGTANPRSSQTGQVIRGLR